MKNSSFHFDFRRNLSLSRRLPLSFMKPIVEQHGGDAIIESELGKGSFFTMTLLLIKQHELHILGS
jgi:signal transduction histidine kinase